MSDDGADHTAANAECSHAADAPQEALGDAAGLRRIVRRRRRIIAGIVHRRYRRCCLHDRLLLLFGLRLRDLQRQLQLLRVLFAVRVLILYDQLAGVSTGLVAVDLEVRVERCGRDEVAAVVALSHRNAVHRQNADVHRLRFAHVDHVEVDGDGLFRRRRSVDDGGIEYHVHRLADRDHDDLIRRTDDL